MSGSIVIFADNFGDRAAVYVHGEDDTIERLDTFIADQRNRINPPTYSNRFDDAEYLAARFVHYILAGSPGGTGAGIVPLDERTDHNLRVHCISESGPVIEDAT